MIGKHSGNLIAEASETPPGNIGKLSDTQTDHLQVSGRKRYRETLGNVGESIGKHPPL